LNTEKEISAIQEALDDAERAALTSLSIFQTRPGAEELVYATVDEQMTSR
jgi:hypothetical protein